MLWDSAVDGTLTFSTLADAWNPLGLAASGRPPFMWNSVDAIGIFVIHSGSTSMGETRTVSGPGVERTYIGTNGVRCETGGFWVRLSLGCTQQRWQVNRPQSSLSTDGATSDGCGPISTTRCINVTGNLELMSTGVGLGWDMALTRRPGLPLNQGGLPTGGGQIVNIDLTDPVLQYWFNLQFNVPFSNVTLPFSFPGPTSASAQMVNVAPSHPDGLALSALNRIVAVDNAGPLTLNLGLDGFNQVFLGQPPFCGQPITFFGTTYTSVFINANGFASFGSGDSWWSPTPSDWSANMPRVGCWSDYDSSQTGTIQVGTQGGVLVASYQSIGQNTYGGAIQGTTNFDLVFDTNTGSVAIDNFAGNPMHNWDSLLGMTPGNGAMDPGSVDFSLYTGSGPRVGPGGNAMIYHFTPGSQPTGYSRVVFPNGDASLYEVF